MSKPTLGRIVLYHSPRGYNGEHVFPAIINRVWSDTMLNVTVFPDCGEPFSATSVEQAPGMPSDPIPANHWQWPPRAEA